MSQLGSCNKWLSGLDSSVQIVNNWIQKYLLLWYKKKIGYDCVFENGKNPIAEFNILSHALWNNNNKLCDIYLHVYISKILWRTLSLWSLCNLVKYLYKVSSRFSLRSVCHFFFLGDLIHPRTVCVFASIRTQLHRSPLFGKGVEKAGEL